LIFQTAEEKSQSLLTPFAEQTTDPRRGRRQRPPAPRPARPHARAPGAVTDAGSDSFVLLRPRTAVSWQEKPRQRWQLLWFFHQPMWLS